MESNKEVNKLLPCGKCGNEVCGIEEYFCPPCDKQHKEWKEKQPETIKIKALESENVLLKEENQELKTELEKVKQEKEEERQIHTDAMKTMDNWYKRLEVKKEDKATQTEAVITSPTK